MITALRIAALVTCGLSAGLFFAFSVSVMPALRALPAAQGIAAMQSINKAILNPVFMLVFLGAPLATVALAVLAPSNWVVVAAAAIVLGSFVVTAAVNVPMNNALDAVAATSGEAEQLWRVYLSRWTAWNHVRALMCTAAVVFLLL